MRETILAAASTIAKAGKPVTMKGVAESVGCHTALVHYYFGTLASLREHAGVVACSHCGGTGQETRA